MGLILILLTGLLWGGIGVVMGVVSRRKLNVLSFVAFATALSSVAAWIVLAKWSPLLAGSVARPVPLVMILVVAGVAGTFGMLCLQRAMTAGAAAWTVGQSAMVIPFLVGVLFLGEPMRICGGLGVVAIVLSFLSFARGDSGVTKVESHGGWFRYAMLAFLLLGTQQALSSVPSSWEGWSDSAGLRVPVVLTAGAIPLCIVALCRGLKLERAAWVLVAAYACFVVAGQYLLFRAMDQLRLEGRLSLAFPLALGTCIVIVALWDIVVWRRRPSALVLAGIGLGALGVVLLAV